MALQVCQITPVSQAHGSNPKTPRHSGHPPKESPTKFINFAGADGVELLLLELAFQILKIDQLFAHKRNLV